MTAMILDDRAFLAVTGPDAEDFLQGIVTTDVAAIIPAEAHPGALLTPQGKILFEFLIGRIPDGFLLETGRGAAEAFAKRLTLYRLRAKVAIDRRPEGTVTLSTGPAAPQGALRDMRFARAGADLFRSAGGEGPAGAVDYLSLRIAHGISGAGEDGDAGEFFPHDLLMDRNGGLNFKKGCYVGQEVVSRMQHRSTARRRLVTVTAEGALPPAGTAVLADGREIGILRREAGSRGLAVVRIDKAGEAMAEGKMLTAGGTALALSLPGWSGLEFPVAADEAAS
jgi:hypothetical protein